MAGCVGENLASATYTFGMHRTKRELSTTVGAGVIAAAMWLSTAGWDAATAVLGAILFFCLAAPAVSALRKIYADVCEIDH
jgi:hypothetical protein